MSLEMLGKRVKHLDYMLNDYPSPVLLGTYRYQVDKLILEAFQEVHKILEEMSNE